MFTQRLTLPTHPPLPTFSPEDLQRELVTSHLDGLSRVFGPSAREVAKDGERRVIDIAGLAGKWPDVGRIDAMVLRVTLPINFPVAPPQIEVARLGYADARHRILVPSTQAIVMVEIEATALRQWGPHSRLVDAVGPIFEALRATMCILVRTELGGMGTGNVMSSPSPPAVGGGAVSPFSPQQQQQQQQTMQSSSSAATASSSLPIPPTLIQTTPTPTTPPVPSFPEAFTRAIAALSPTELRVLSASAAARAAALRGGIGGGVPALKIATDAAEAATAAAIMADPDTDTALSQELALSAAAVVEAETLAKATRRDALSALAAVRAFKDRFTPAALEIELKNEAESAERRSEDVLAIFNDRASAAVVGGGGDAAIAEGIVRDFRASYFEERTRYHVASIKRALVHGGALK